MPDPVKHLVLYSRGLFERLEEFFVRATGHTVQNFCTVSEFDEVIRASASQIAPKAYEAFAWLDNEVRQYIAREGMEAFRSAKELGGLRLVLGGSSRFGETQLNSVNGSVLYSDTILVPDPIMPWLERERTEERFQHVLVLKTVHCLLQLKPLIDADLPYPALVVFPSREKLLEENDDQTKSGIQQLVVDVVAWSTGEALSAIEEVLEFSDRHSNAFFNAVNRSKLFVAPGGSTSDSLSNALAEYESHLRTWRSEGWLRQYDELPTQRKILNGLFERIGPIYHMLENAQEFMGHPLMCVEQQAHYFQIVSQSASNRLTALEQLDPNTSALVRGLSSRRFKWLGSVDINAIVQLRKDNENEAFRHRLSGALNRLSESTLNSVDRVAAEVCREIDGALANHARDMRIIQEKYNRIHGQTTALGIGALGAALMPALSPLLGGAIPLGLAVKYGHDKLAEVQEKRRLTRSFAGVLASVKG